MKHPPRIAGVIGWPIAHSRSPLLHRYWLEQYHIDGAYLPFAVTPGRLETALRGLAGLGVAGCNVTIPHKEETARIVDTRDAIAERMGAVNLVVVQPDGSLHGSNTDGFGFIENMRACRPSWQAASGPAVVVGAGGAARSVVAALLDAGAPEIRLLNRRSPRAERLAADLGGPLIPHEWSAAAGALEGASLLVNATSAGMEGHPALDLSLDPLPASAVVCDVIYTPLETPLLRDAAARGLATVDGLGMLLHQARPSFAAWFGVMPDASPELRALVEKSLGEG